MEKLYYLREGDFLPEPIETLCTAWRRNLDSIVEFLSKNGNIFTTKEDALEASKVVRSALIAHQVRQGHHVEIRISADSLRQDLH